MGRIFYDLTFIYVNINKVSRMTKDWHSMGVEDVLKELDSGMEGLDPEQVKERQEKFGANELREMKRETPFQMFLSQFKNFLVIILIFAALFL